MFLRQVIKKHIYKKPLGHHFYDERNMFQVGG